MEFENISSDSNESLNIGQFFLLRMTSISSPRVFGHLPKELRRVGVRDDADGPTIVYYHNGLRCFQADERLEEIVLRCHRDGGSLRMIHREIEESEEATDRRKPVHDGLLRYDPREPSGRVADGELAEIVLD